MTNYSNYAIQLNNLVLADLINSSYQLFIVEGSPQVSGPSAPNPPMLSDDEISTLIGHGRVVAGYVNTSVTDSNRSYWDPNWTSGSNSEDDLNALTATAPDWLRTGVQNQFGRVVDFRDQQWQDIVIAQAVDLVSRGYSGVYLDDVTRYIDLFSDVAQTQALANDMMQFVTKIGDAIREINPNAILIANGGPYIISDGGQIDDGNEGRTGSDFSQAIDAMLLDNLYHDDAAFDAAVRDIQPYAQLLATQFEGDFQFASDMWERGIIPYATRLEGYVELTEVVFPGTINADNLTGDNADNLLSGLQGNDTITGNGGNDVINGGTGIDTAKFTGQRADYALIKTGNTITVSQVGTSAVDGVDMLTNVEILQFTDRAYNLQAVAKAATIAVASLDSIVDLYVAYFNRVPEASGLMYWIDQFAAGKTLAQMAIDFYAAGVANSATTGYTADMAINNFITILYKNVLGRTGADAPNTEELTYWSNEVSTGAVTREGMVARFLGDARNFYDHAEFGFVPRLLDQKVDFGKLHAITYGVDYADPATSIQTTINLAAAVTSTSTDAAVVLMGLGTDDYVV